MEMIENLEEKLKDILIVPKEEISINNDEYIKQKIYIALSDISGFDVNNFKDDSDLKSDLGLSLYHKRALRNYFQNIISDLNSLKIITVKECETLKKVTDCFKLVKSKI